MDETFETRHGWPTGTLELRASGRTLVGRFPYRSTATVADHGHVRKERFEPRAFRFAVEDKDREINLLFGHSYDRPLASKLRGSLELADGDDALTFKATLPEQAAQPTWMRDAVLAVEGGLVAGISPGFRVPPAAVVPDAEWLVDEPGNPGIQIRVIREALLVEMSLVTRPAYNDTEVDLREAFGARHDVGRRRRRLWL